MSCDVDEVTERLENELCYDYNYELCSFSNPSVASPTSLFILRSFFRFSYVTSTSLNSPGEPPMKQSSFYNLSVTSPMTQLVLQPFRRFTYVTDHSPTLPSLYLRHGHSPTLPLLHLRHSSFPNPSFASPKLKALHLRHLASRPLSGYW